MYSSAALCSIFHCKKFFACILYTVCLCSDGVDWRRAFCLANQEYNGYIHASVVLMHTNLHTSARTHEQTQACMRTRLHVCHTLQMVARKHASNHIHKHTGTHKA